MARAAFLAVLLLAAPASAETIAVLDTGIDDEHPEFAGRVERRSFVEYAPLPVGLPGPVIVEDDTDGHGTEAASVAAGSSLGVASTASLLDLQVAVPALPLAATEDAAIRAMDWLLENHGGDPAVRVGPRVVLLSFADQDLGEYGAETLAAQAERLRGMGVVLVVPGGPDSALQRSRAVLTVAAEAGCEQASYAVKPDVAAPGEADAAQPGTPVDPGPTAVVSGTHVAAAHVAGVAAVMWQARPDLPADALMAIARGTASDLGVEGPDDCSGFGRVEADFALQGATEWMDPFEPRPEEASTWGLAVLLVAVVALASRRR